MCLYAALSRRDLALALRDVLLDFTSLHFVISFAGYDFATLINCISYWHEEALRIVGPSAQSFITAHRHELCRAEGNVGATDSLIRSAVCYSGKLAVLYMCTAFTYLELLYAEERTLDGSI